MAIARWDHKGGSPAAPYVYSLHLKLRADNTHLGLPELFTWKSCEVPALGLSRVTFPNKVSIS